MNAHRLRTELHATPAEEQGVKFYDVSDPRSGVSMRLYDFEWLLASQMDGKRSLDEIAAWGRGNLHLDVSADALAQYASRLEELGFFTTDFPVETVDHEAITAISTPALVRGEETERTLTSRDSSTLTPLPPPRPGVDRDDAPIEIESERTPELVTEKQVPLVPRAPAPIAPPVAPVAKAPQREWKPDASATVKEPVDAPKSGAGSIIGLIAVLVVLGGVVAYVKLAPGAAKVTIAMAKPSDVVRLYDGASKLDKAPPKTLAFGEAGKVLDVVAAGADVKAGTALATLETFTKVEKDLVDVKDRLGFYQKQLDAASAKGDAAAQSAAEAKVAEKKKLLADLEAHAQKLRLVAPGPAVVAKVNVAAGGDAKPDVPAVELTDKRVVAVFKLPLGSALSVGDGASLQAAGGGQAFPAKVAAVDAGTVTLEVPDDGAHKSGEAVRLVKARLSGVYTVPTSAVVKVGGADSVYVLTDGAVHAKRVTVADRSGNEAYISTGLAAGDSIVVSGGEGLTDGQKASANP